MDGPIAEGLDRERDGLSVGLLCKCAQNKTERERKMCLIKHAHVFPHPSPVSCVTPSPTLFLFFHVSYSLTAQTTGCSGHTAYIKKRK